MPSPKGKKSSTPSSSKAPSKQSAKRGRPQTKTTTKRNTSKKPAKPTKAKLKKPTKQHEPIKPSEASVRDEPDLNPPIVEGAQGVWNEVYKYLIPDSVTKFDILSSTRLEDPKYEMKSYRVICGYQGNEEKREACEVAMLVLYAGTPKDQAKKALELILKKLPESPENKGPQPLNLKLHMTIRFYLLQFIKDPDYINRLRASSDPPIVLPRNKKISGAAYCQAIATQFGVSKSLVARAYSKLLTEKGYPKRTYHKG